MYETYNYLISFIKNKKNIKNKVKLIPNPDTNSSYFSFPERKDVKEFLKSGKKFF